MVGRLAVSALVATALVAAACGSPAESRLSIYTSVTQETVDAVVAGFEAHHGEVTVEVFRAPTGELNARIAAEQREGGLQADVLWLTDPLSMQQYAAAGVLQTASPEGAGEIPPAFRTETFWGTRILNLVVVHGAEVPAPATWYDLVDLAASGGVALPDPGFAGSAFAALGFFATREDFGLDFYRDLARAGAVQVATPGEVVTGVAEGRYAAGITLDFVARTARDKGSPIGVAWPQPGAIALYSPIGVVDAGSAAVEFVEYVLSPEGQSAIAASGWQPVRDDVAWDRAGPRVTIDWSEVFDRQEELRAGYRAIFDG